MKEVVHVRIAGRATDNEARSMTLERAYTPASVSIIPTHISVSFSTPVAIPSISVFVNVTAVDFEASILLMRRVFL